jgi:hypothetical protein
LKYFILLPLILSGCATATITTKSVDGKVSECAATYFSFFKASDESSLSACGAKGKTSGSESNTALLQEIVKRVPLSP